MQRSRIGRLALIIAVLLTGKAHADDAGPGGYRFQPPRPPSVEDFYDDDEMELGDEPMTGIKPPTTPAPPPPPANNMPMEDDSFSRGVRDTKKLTFEVVDGVYYEKGKKRGRGKQFRIAPGTQSGAGNRSSGGDF